MSVRTLALASLATSLLVLVPSAVADPTTDNNKNLIQRTLMCDVNGQQVSFPSEFVAPMGSNFNGTGNQQVFVYKYLTLGETVISRGVQGVSNNHDLITCQYDEPDGHVVVTGFFTGPSS
jgi:hypothetical protein